MGAKGVQDSQFWSLGVRFHSHSDFGFQNPEALLREGQIAGRTETESGWKKVDEEPGEQACDQGDQGGVSDGLFCPLRQIGGNMISFEMADIDNICAKR